MVIFSRFRRFRRSGKTKGVLFVFALFLALTLGACSVDLLGFFSSEDLDARFADKNTFHLLTPPDRNLSLGDTYSFVVVTDVHIEDTNAWGLEKLKGVLLPPSDPGGGDKFVVVTGDITHNGREENLRKFIEIARDLGVPCYPVLGNHDIYFNHWPVWRDLIGSSIYRINAGSATLFILDTANASLGAAQFNWLKNELQSAAPRVFVFTHVNFFVEAMDDHQQLTDIKERSRIITLLNGRCEAVFSGHVHKRILRDIEGVRYLSIEDYRRYKTYCRVYVSPKGMAYDFKTLRG